MFCSWSARQSGDQLVGTAAEATHWLCIEVPTAWPPRPLSDGLLPDRLTRQCDEWQEVLPGLRIQLIRREVGTSDIDGQTTVFAAEPRPAGGMLRRLRVDALEAVADLEVPALFDATPPEGVRDVPGSIALVCVHGNRDKCCARWGRALHASLADRASHAVWQTSHLGGHRFAPTCVFLPEGIHYGWLAADEADGLWDAHRDGRIYRLDRYRGFVGSDRPVQAAEAFLRQDLELVALDALAVEGVKKKGTTWRVRMSTPDENYEVKVDRVNGGTVQKSCDGDPKTVQHYRLEGLRSL